MNKKMLLVFRWMYALGFGCYAAALYFELNRWTHMFALTAILGLAMHVIASFTYAMLDTSKYIDEQHQPAKRLKNRDPVSS